MGYRRCPRPDKRGYPSQYRAESDVQKISRSSRARGHKKPSRAYECECGLWHLTSRKEPIGVPS